MGADDEMVATFQPSTDAAKEPGREGTQKRQGDPAFMLSREDIRLLGITATGNFLDAYDYFVINPVSTMLQYELFAGESLPPKLEGFLKSGALIGAAFGQLLFGVYASTFSTAPPMTSLTGLASGYLGDALGRKAIYGKELLTVIIGTILCLSTPTSALSPSNSLIYLASFRIVVGIGIGGDYPMSSSISADRTEPWKRGAVLSYIDSMQGWGSLVGSLVAIAVLAAYKHAIHDQGEIHKLDAGEVQVSAQASAILTYDIRAVWRITVGLSLIPAFATIYQRLTLPESPLHSAARNKYNCQVGAPPKDMSAGELRREPDEKMETEDTIVTTENLQPKAHLWEFFEYFSEWRHAKHLIGTCLCWFLTNITLFGLGLNHNFVLQQLGFQGITGTTWQKLFKLSTGGLVLTTLGSLPAAILAVKFHSLSKAPFILFPLMIEGCCVPQFFATNLWAAFSLFELF
ncbi:hypothetical protein EYR38_003152 [Pleurotus pulmonarius]|nr:hypothetical protein EYR38_003152 [Pleurotus pulmonarius]